MALKLCGLGSSCSATPNAASPTRTCDEYLLGKSSSCWSQVAIWHWCLDGHPVCNLHEYGFISYDRWFILLVICIFGMAAMPTMIDNAVETADRLSLGLKMGCPLEKLPVFSSGSLKKPSTSEGIQQPEGMGKSVTTPVWVLIYLFITEDMLFLFYSLLFAQLGVRIWGLWDMVLFFFVYIFSASSMCFILIGFYSSSSGALWWYDTGLYLA